MSNPPVAAAGPLADRAQTLLDGSLAPPPIARLIPSRLLAAEPDHAVFELETDLARHANPVGTLHTGVLCDLAEAAMGVASGSALARGETFTTLELKIKFLKPVREGRLTATGRLVHGGRAVGLPECDVVDATSRLVARAGSTGSHRRAAETVAR